MPSSRAWRNWHGQTITHGAHPANRPCPDRVGTGGKLPASRRSLPNGSWTHNPEASALSLSTALGTSLLAVFSLRPICRWPSHSLICPPDPQVGSYDIRIL